MSHEFTDAIESYFVPFLEEQGFRIAAPIAISGKHYFARFGSGGFEIMVSYEPGDDYLTVILGPPLSGFVLPSPNDASPRVCQENQEYFARCVSSSDLERRLLKAAQDLRLRFRSAAQQGVAPDGRPQTAARR